MADYSCKTAILYPFPEFQGFFKYINFKLFLEKEKLIYTGIKENLAKQPASEKIRTRLAEVEDILHYNELALQFYV